MNGSVEDTIAHLRTAVGATTDAELARRLDVDQSTISSWRARGRVPNRYVKELLSPANERTADHPAIWGEMENRAIGIALARYALLHRNLLTSSDVDRVMTAFLDPKPWWLVLNRAVHDLRGKMIGLDVDPSTAQALILNDDLRNPDETAKRVSAELREDLADNPDLRV
jgi:Bacteriophage CI repressor helix-turn-helix domain